MIRKRMAAIYSYQPQDHREVLSVDRLKSIKSTTLQSQEIFGQ